jgi:hypothetical protein
MQELYLKKMSQKENNKIMHFKTFEDFLNESMIKTLVGKPHEYTRELKQNETEYSKIITKEVAQKFKLEDSLFKAEFLFQLKNEMNEYSATIMLINSGGSSEKEKLAYEIADYMEKFLEKDSRVKGVENSIGYNKKTVGVFQKDNDKSGNWIISWRPKLFIRKTN